MRDPMSWSIPLFRVFGIQVKLHILYIVITLAMLLKVYSIDRHFFAEYAVTGVATDVSSSSTNSGTASRPDELMARLKKS